MFLRSVIMMMAAPNLSPSKDNVVVPDPASKTVDDVGLEWLRNRNGLVLFIGFRFINFVDFIMDLEGWNRFEKEALVHHHRRGHVG